MKQRLVGLCFLFVLLACSNEKSPTHPNAATAATELEQRVQDLVNGIRTSQGLEMLQWNEQIAIIGRIHSQNMANGKTDIGHNGFDARADDIYKIISWQRIGENVAFSRGANDPVAKAVDGWMKSQGHQDNILGDFNITGIGVAENGGGYYFTQIFVKK